MRYTAGLALAGAVLVSACPGGDGGTSSGPVTRDSAGIAIVENSGPVWAAGAGWHVVDSPLVDIGGRTGEAPYELDQVNGPVRLSDGRIALGNGASKEIRYYNSAGEHQRSSGREGSGPGEFQFLTGLWKGPADSVMVFDVMVRRLSVLDKDGGFARSISLGGASGAPMPTDGKVDFAVPIVWLEDGSVLGQAMVFAIGQDRKGSYRDSITIIRYAADGAVQDTVGRFPGPEMQQMTLTFGTQSVNTPQEAPLGRQTVSAARGGNFYLSLNNAWEIEVRALDGTLKRLIRTPTTPKPITPADIEAYRGVRQEQMEAVPQIRNLPDQIKKQVLSQMEKATYPATFAYFSRLLIDSEGNLWAQEVTPPADKAQSFAVIDSNGRFLGRVVMPTDFTPTQIESDAVYGVWKDADDLQHVRAYPLRKS
jgi:hypothetical protein